jgi:hypothetical protein
VEDNLYTLDFITTVGETVQKEDKSGKQVVEEMDGI